MFCPDEVMSIYLLSIWKYGLATIKYSLSFNSFNHNVFNVKIKA